MDPGIRRTDAVPPTEGPTRDPTSLRRLRWLVPLAAALLVFVVIAGIEAVRQSDKMSGSTEVQTAGFYKPTSTQPVAFSLPVLQAAAPSPSRDVHSVTMASLRGEPVVLNMWSSSCSICKEETPAMEAIARRVEHIVRFVGVDTLDEKSTALAFLRRYHVTYLQLFDQNEQVGSGYGIPGLPVTMFVSAQGKVVGEYLGALNTKTLGYYVRTLFGVRLPSS
jgi:thiol-disulfide isomerase/thioredoxin